MKTVLKFELQIIMKTLLKFELLHISFTLQKGLTKSNSVNIYSTIEFTINTDIVWNQLKNYFNRKIKYLVYTLIV